VTINSPDGNKDRSKQLSLSAKIYIILLVKVMRNKKKKIESVGSLAREIIKVVATSSASTR